MITFVLLLIAGEAIAGIVTVRFLLDDISQVRCRQAKTEVDRDRELAQLNARIADLEEQAPAATADAHNDLAARVEALETWRAGRKRRPREVS